MSNEFKRRFYNHSSQVVDNMKSPCVPHYPPLTDPMGLDQHQHCYQTPHFQPTVDHHHHEAQYGNLQMNGTHHQQLGWSASSAEYPLGQNLQFNNSLDLQERQTFVTTTDCHTQHQPPSSEQFYSSSQSATDYSYQQHQHNHYSNLWHPQVHNGPGAACNSTIDAGYQYTGYNYGDTQHNQYHTHHVPLDERHTHLENIKNNAYHYHHVSGSNHTHDDKILSYATQETKSSNPETLPDEQNVRKSSDDLAQCDNLAQTNWLNDGTTGATLCRTDQTMSCVPSGGDLEACDTPIWPPASSATSSFSTATRDWPLETNKVGKQNSISGPKTSLPDTVAKRPSSRPSRTSAVAPPAVVAFDEGVQQSSLEEMAAMRRRNQCHVCGRNYARPSTLKTHLRTHTNERPFKCNVCLKTFSQAANLTAHQRVHTGERPFSCPICGRQFSQSSSVITHLRTHSGERPYRCINCERTFSDSSTLTKHCRIHSGEKPYQCEYCPLNFSQSGNLSRHLKLHLISGTNGNGNCSSGANQQSNNHHHQTTSGLQQSTTSSSSSSSMASAAVANYHQPPAHGSSSSRSGSTSTCSSAGDILAYTPTLNLQLPR